MKCIKCNNEIPQGSSFCSFCGVAVENVEPIKKISLKCEECNGILTVDSDKNVLACPYCGSKSLIIESDAVTIERIRTSAQKEIEMEKIKSNDRFHEMESKKQEIEKFKKSVGAKLLIFVFLISAVFTYFYFSSGRVLAGILSLIQAICFGSAWCMGMNIIREKKRYIHILFAIIGIVLIAPTMRACGEIDISEDKDIEEIKWSIICMGDKIPEPNSKVVEIHDNTEVELWIGVHNTSETEYYEYISACKTMGYTVEMDETSIGYEAYSDEGYHLDLGYYKTNKEMSIHLESPTEVGDLKWDTHKVSSILPVPKSSTGLFKEENEKENKIIISNISKEEFNDYCESCKEVGFTVDSESRSGEYSAYDKNGNKINISHNTGNKEMTIRFKYPMIFEKIKWPTVGIGTIAPVPGSLSGNVANDYDWTYSVYLEKISRTDYESYVQKCIDAGFDKNISNYGDSFWADYSNDDDIGLNVSYEGFNIMYIHISGSINEDYSSLKRKTKK